MAGLANVHAPCWPPSRTAVVKPGTKSWELVASAARNHAPAVAT